MISPIKTALATALVCLSFAALAQETLPPAPEMTTATYRAWTLRCVASAGDGNLPVCEVGQTLTAAETGSPVARIALGRLGADQPVKLVVQVPTGVWLPADVRIDAPDGRSLTANFIACGQLCAAEAFPDEAFIATLKSAQAAATLTFQNGAQQPVEVEISLDGLATALAALESGGAAN